MRALTALLCLVALAFGEDLRPRSGGGWDGFEKNTSVKLKMTHIPHGQNARVTLMTTTLVKSNKSTITTETVATNVLGMKNTTRSTVPRSGEAGRGEKQSTEKLKNETLTAAGRRFECTRVRTTVTGPAGKRVVTEWTGLEPKIRVKRTEAHYDSGGKLARSRTILLSSLSAERKVGTRKVDCLVYKMVQKAGKIVDRTTVYTSRAVPGDTVYADGEQTENGMPAGAYRIEVLDFTLGR